VQLSLGSLSEIGLETICNHSNPAIGLSHWHFLNSLNAIVVAGCSVTPTDTRHQKMIPSSHTQALAKRYEHIKLLEQSKDELIEVCHHITQLPHIWRKDMSLTGRIASLALASTNERA